MKMRFHEMKPGIDKVVEGALERYLKTELLFVLPRHLMAR